MPGLTADVMMVGVPALGSPQQRMAALLVNNGVQEFKAQKGKIEARYSNQAQSPAQQG